MARLQIIAGPNIGQVFPLTSERMVIGREPTVHVHLEPLAVSREHAVVTCKEGQFFLEDLGSLNRTYLNSQPLPARKPTPIREVDRIQIGPFVLQLKLDQVDLDGAPNVTATISATPANLGLYSSNPAQKLRSILEIARHLGTTLELDPLLDRLLSLLFTLFPQADRGMILLLEREGGGRRLDDSMSQLLFRVRAQRTRNVGTQQDFPFSRSLVNRAMESGEGLLSENVGQDVHVPMTRTMTSLELRSFLCIPLLGTNNRRLGVLQLDALRGGSPFTHDDLDLLTAIALQVSTVVEKSLMHAELIRRAKTDQELQAACEIQMSLLPQNFPALERGRGIELFARVLPARGVAGDLYDLFPLDEGRLAFFIGDVSGKGMPAALYMVAARTLMRQLSPQLSSPAHMIVRLHQAMIADHPTNQFVTLLAGIYDASNGEIVFSTAGHPEPFLRKKSGAIQLVPTQRTLMVGNPLQDPDAGDTRVQLEPGDTFICYTDGFFEAYDTTPERQFGMNRLQEILTGARTPMPLKQCFEEAALAVRRYIGNADQQDDQTLLLIRRRETERNDVVSGSGNLVR